MLTVIYCKFSRNTSGIPTYLINKFISKTQNIYLLLLFTYSRQVTKKSTETIPYSSSQIRLVARRQPKREAHQSIRAALKGRPVVAPHFGRGHVGGAFVIWFGQHADHAEQDFFHALHRRPALGTGFVAGRVVARGVQNALEGEIRGKNKVKQRT